MKYRSRAVVRNSGKKAKRNINLEINLDIKQCATQANKNIGLPSAGHSDRQIIYQWPAPAAAISFSLRVQRGEILVRNKCRIETLRAVRCVLFRYTSRFPYAHRSSIRPTRARGGAARRNRFSHSSDMNFRSALRDKFSYQSGISKLSKSLN